jgi:hypothetical protein
VEILGESEQIPARLLMNRSASVQKGSFGY